MGLGYTLNDLGEYADAESELRAVLKIQEKVLGPEHLDTLWTRNDLADALEGQGKYADAEAEYRVVANIMEQSSDRIIVTPCGADGFGCRA